MERDRWGRQVRIRFGDHALRFGGMLDLLTLADGCSVLDIGCNRGLMCYHFAVAGARLVHGVDYYDKGIETAREWFADLGVQSQFEALDLAKDGPNKLTKAFGEGHYDIVLLSAVVHKLRRQMDIKALRELLDHIGKVTARYVAARVVDEDRDLVGSSLGASFECAHWSVLDPTLGQAVIWKRRI